MVRRLTDWLSVRCTPLGRPVVPDVYIIARPSTGSGMSAGSSDARASSNGVNPSTSPPTARRRVAAGAPPAASAATPANRASATKALASQSSTM